jgi:hypothetical protein
MAEGEGDAELKSSAAGAEGEAVDGA